MQSVARSWAIHFIDAKLPCALLEMQTESKQFAALLSDLPYYCPNTLTKLSPSWTSRRIHFSRDKSYKQDYVIHFHKNENDTEKKPFLRLHFYENDDSAFATIIDEQGRVWSDDCCLMWREKRDANSLWNVCWVSSTPFSPKKVALL